MARKINEADLEWEIPSHEDPNNVGTWKKVLVRHDEVDHKSKLMMVNFARVLVGRTHPEHKHPTMEEIFYFLEGEGQVVLDGKAGEIKAGDRIIVPAGVSHKIINTGKIELKFLGFGTALD
jgi:mannose-6-phosphate isomerase-like protein (cupin superfamily)